MSHGFTWHHVALGRTIIATGQGWPRNGKQLTGAGQIRPVFDSADRAGEAQRALRPPPGGHQEGQRGYTGIIGDYIHPAGAAAGAAHCGTLRRLEPGGQMKLTTSHIISPCWGGSSMKFYSDWRAEYIVEVPVLRIPTPTATSQQTYSLA